jgi:hypothetical protein
MFSICYVATAFTNFTAFTENCGQNCRQICSQEKPLRSSARAFALTLFPNLTLTSQIAIPRDRRLGSRLLAQILARRGGNPFG